LTADRGELRSADEAADWVDKNLAAKNTLAIADVDLVEAVFREKLATIQSTLTPGRDVLSRRGWKDPIPRLTILSLRQWTTPPRLRPSCPQV